MEREKAKQILWEIKMMVLVKVMLIKMGTEIEKEKVKKIKMMTI